MRRSLYSNDKEHVSPLVDIFWDRGALMIEAKAGTLDIGQLQRTITQAIKEIQEAVTKGKQNATQQDSDESPAGTRTKNQSAKDIPG